MKHNINGLRASSNDYLLDYMFSIVDNDSSLLDLGCGPKLYSDPFKEKCNKILTIDAWDSVNPDIVADLEKQEIFDLVNGQMFDYIWMIDFIEHLDKDVGLKLIEDCKKIVNKKILLLTPLEEIWTDNQKNVDDPLLWCYGNSYDLHKSVWDKSDFSDWIEVKLPKMNNYFVGYFSK